MNWIFFFTFFLSLNKMWSERKKLDKKGNCGNLSTSVILSEHKTDRPCRWPILFFFMEQLLTWNSCWRALFRTQRYNTLKIGYRVKLWLLSSHDKERTEHAPSAITRTFPKAPLPRSYLKKKTWFLFLSCDRRRGSYDSLKHVGICNRTSWL